MEEVQAAAVKESATTTAEAATEAAALAKRLKKVEADWAAARKKNKAKRAELEAALAAATAEASALRDEAAAAAAAAEAAEAAGAPEADAAAVEEAVEEARRERDAAREEAESARLDVQHGGETVAALTEEVALLAAALQHQNRALLALRRSSPSLSATSSSSASPFSPSTSASSSSSSSSPTAEASLDEDPAEPTAAEDPSLLAEAASLPLQEGDEENDFVDDADDDLALGTMTFDPSAPSMSPLPSPLSPELALPPQEEAPPAEVTHQIATTEVSAEAQALADEAGAPAGGGGSKRRRSIRLQRKSLGGCDPLPPPLLESPGAKQPPTPAATAPVEDNNATAFGVEIDGMPMDDATDDVESSAAAAVAPNQLKDTEVAPEPVTTETTMKEPESAAGTVIQEAASLKDEAAVGVQGIDEFTGATDSLAPEAAVPSVELEPELEAQTSEPGTKKLQNKKKKKKGRRRRSGIFGGEALLRPSAADLDAAAAAAEEESNKQQGGEEQEQRNEKQEPSLEEPSGALSVQVATEEETKAAEQEAVLEDTGGGLLHWGGDDLDDAVHEPHTFDELAIQDSSNTHLDDGAESNGATPEDMDGEEDVVVEEEEEEQELSLNVGDLAQYLGELRPSEVLDRPNVHQPHNAASIALAVASAALYDSPAMRDAVQPLFKAAVVAEAEVQSTMQQQQSQQEDANDSSTGRKRRVRFSSHDFSSVSPPVDTIRKSEAPVEAAAVLLRRIVDEKGAAAAAAPEALAAAAAALRGVVALLLDGGKRGDCDEGANESNADALSLVRSAVVGAGLSLKVVGASARLLSEEFAAVEAGPIQRTLSGFLLSAIRYHLRRLLNAPPPPATTPDVLQVGLSRTRSHDGLIEPTFYGVPLTYVPLTHFCIARVQILPPPPSPPTF
jgi:hypothetical protein